MRATREICKLCYEPVRVGFGVPDEIWNIVAPLNKNILCLQCFTKIADEKMIDWDKDIQFYPVSFVSHLELNNDRDGNTIQEN